MTDSVWKNAAALALLVGLVLLGEDGSRDAVIALAVVGIWLCLR